jgi:hypothetical protein
MATPSSSRKAETGGDIGRFHRPDLERRLSKESLFAAHL